MSAMGYQIWTNSPTLGLCYQNWQDRQSEDKPSSVKHTCKLAIVPLKKQYGKKIAIQRALANKLLNVHPIFNEGGMSRPHIFYDFAETKY